jgi:hypothetical protein
MPNPEPPIKGQTLAAEGGGAVGNIPPVVIPAQPAAIPMDPSWGQGPGGDPFIALRQQQAAEEVDAMQGMEDAIQMGAAIREKYDNREGVFGAIDNFLARRKALKDSEKAKAAVPTSLAVGE